MFLPKNRITFFPFKKEEREQKLKLSAKICFHFSPANFPQDWNLVMLTVLKQRPDRDPSTSHMRARPCRLCTRLPTSSAIPSACCDCWAALAQDPSCCSPPVSHASPNPHCSTEFAIFTHECHELISHVRYHAGEEQACKGKHTRPQPNLE